MSRPPIRRRDFLRSGALAAAGAALAPLLDARRAAAREVAAVPVHLPLAADAYSLAPDVTYLNHASIGTIPRVVQQARHRYLELCETNPWLYMWGPAWQQPREEVRTTAAGVLGCDADEVALIHNTTEAFNLLAHGLPLGPGDEVLFSSLNHAGASVAWEQQAKSRGFRVRRFDFPVHRVPEMTPEDVVAVHAEALSRSTDRPTRVLVLPHIDNTVGLRHPVREIAAAARQRGVRWIAVDGAQSVGMLPVNIAELGVDAYATSPHKWLQAPKGPGLLYLRREIQSEVEPMWVTWGQGREGWKGTARVFEDYGTRNLPEVLALGDAIAFQERLGSAAKEAHHRRLWEHARREVESRPGLIWRSPTRWDLSAALWAVEVEGQASDALCTRLFRDHGFVFRPFSTLGLNTLRISPNLMSRTTDLDRLLDRLLEAVGSLTGT